MDRPDRTTPDAAVVRTVSRGLQVLRAFRCECTPLTNAELVRRTGLSKAVVSRFTTTLTQLGYLRHRAPGRDFELAAASLAVGHAYAAANPIAPVVEPAMQALADRMQASVALAVAEGHEMLYLAYRAGHGVATLRLGTGSVLPMASTSVGHAYLWGLPDEARTRQLARLAAAAGEGAEALARRVDASFRELALTGVCGVLGGYQRDAYGVAMPLRLGRGRTLMALSCGKAGMRPDLVAERRRIAPELERTAAELQRQLADADVQP